MFSKRRSNISEPRLQVVEASAWRKPVVMLSLGVIGVACILLGFVLGQNQVVVARVSSALLSQDLNEAQVRLQQMEGELIDARLNAQVASEAAESLRQDLALMQSSHQELQQEVTFYKSLMDPGSLVQGLQITELELAPGGTPLEYRFQLLLTQVAQRRSYIAGDVRVDVIGQQGEDPAEVVLSLTEMTEVAKYHLKFKFRYFQDLSGSMTLPEQFVPKRVLITAQQQGKQAQQQTFPWPEWSQTSA